MKAKKILPAFLLTALIVVLIVLVSSRNAEKVEWTPYPSGDVSLDGGGSAAPDNDLSNIAQEPVTPTPVPTPAPTVYKPDVDVTSWQYILVNADHNIGTYTPEVTEIEQTAQYFDSRAIDALEDFLNAARDAGYTPYISGAYRPYSAQEYLFNGKASQIAWGGQYTYAEAVEKAKSVVAYPGTSEHQTGLCCDITDKYYQTMDASKMDQALLTWLREHCAEYGFIQRYPSDKASITGWDEPWHYRYVGTEAAQYIMDNNLCLEEFWDLYQ